MAADDSETTLAGLRETIAKVGAAAHTMHNALAPLSDGSDSYAALAPDFEYLSTRAREVSKPTKGRPVVPALPADVPDLPVLLTRIASDLRVLRTACEFAADGIAPDRNAAKGRERQLVQAVARAHLEAFGKLPPKRSWFADDLMDYIGTCLGLSIGHRVVGEVVDGMSV